MSGEFGNCATAPYMHDKVREAAVDCSESGIYNVTCAFGRLLGVLAPIARLISYAEARDIDEEDVGIAIRKGRKGIIRTFDEFMGYADDEE